jgi:hypothetical protein
MSSSGAVNAGNSASPTPAPAAPSPSLDDEIKRLQRDKLTLEVRHLKGLSLDAAAKLLVAALGIAAAAWAVYIGLIKAQSDLIDARERVTAQTKLLEKQSTDLADLDARRAQVTEVYEQLQAKVRALQEQTQKVAAAGTATQGAAVSDLKAQLADAARPTLFVQFAGDLNRETLINPLRQRLANNGFNVPGAERINRGQRNQIKYFANTEEERASAEKIASIVTAYFKEAGCPLPALETRFVENTNGKRSPPELWLMHSCTKPAG